jgi:hypothetical protein
MKTNFLFSTILVLAVTVNTAVLTFQGLDFSIIIFVVSFAYLIFRNRISIDKPFFLWIFYLVIIMIVQIFYFTSEAKIIHIFGKLVTLLLPFFILKITDRQFEKSYLLILFVIIGFTTPVYIGTIIFPSFDNLVLNFARNNSVTDSNNLGVYSSGIYSYCVNTDIGYYSVLRNAGIFWEPGAYAMFLILGLIITFYKYGTLINIHGLIITLVLVTTQSTAGYLAFVFLLIANLIHEKKISLAVVSFVLLSSFIVIFKDSPFINEKITKELTNVDYSSNYGDVGVGRLYKATKAFNNIINHPLIGRGFLSSIKNTRDIFERDNYSIFSVAAQIGILGFLIYITGFYYGLKYRISILGNKIGNESFLLLLSLFIVMSSSGAFFGPIFLIYLCSGLTNNSNIVNLFHKRGKVIF